MSKNIIIEEVSNETTTNAIPIDELLKQKSKSISPKKSSATINQKFSLYKRSKYPSLLTDEFSIKLCDENLEDPPKKMHKIPNSTKKLLIRQDSETLSLKEKIESLENQLSEEKTKFEVLKEIAEDEKKKHILYREKYQKVKNLNYEIVAKVKKKKNKDKKNKELKKESNNNLEIIRQTATFNTSNVICNNSGELELSARNKADSPTKKDVKENTKVIDELNEKIEKLNAELNKVNEDINNKNSLIKKLYEKIEEFQETKKTLNFEKQKLVGENKKLSQEISEMKSKISKINTLYDNEKKEKEKNLKKLKDLSNKNDQLHKDIKNLKDLNKKLRNQIYANNQILDTITAKNNQILSTKNTNNKKDDNKIIIVAKNVGQLDTNSYEISERSLGINKMNDFSDISSIPKKPQIEQDDVTTLNELLNKNSEKEFDKNDLIKKNKKKYSESDSCSDGSDEDSDYE